MEIDVIRLKTDDGVELAAHSAGSVDAPTVLLLHGGGQTQHSWRETLERLASMGYRAVSYDARGHGDSEWSHAGEYTVEVWARDLAAVLGCVRAPFALVGASMGGIAALYAVGKGFCTPPRALVLVDITARPAASGAKRIYDFMRRHHDGFGGVEEAVEAVSAYNPHRERPSDTSGIMKNLRLRDDGRLYWHWDPRLLDDVDVDSLDDLETKILDACAGVRAPTLLVRGKRSDIVDEQGIDAMRQRIPGLELCDVAEAGHMLTGDRNSVFDSALLMFLERHMPP